MEADWPQLKVLGEVAVAMLLGGVIGFEREVADRPAGLRTHMLLAGACALIVGLGGAMLSAFQSSHPSVVSADPFRLVGGVIAALGFIGAGTIFQRGGKTVEGLTTATAMLFSGGVGVSAALEQWWIAVGATLLALVVLRGAWFMERRVNQIGKAPPLGRSPAAGDAAE
jgi:putative Mg2+ transporter-C (MgtC) family protein